MEPVKPPVESVVIITGFVAIALLSYDIVLPEFATKLLPEMFTVVPVGPLVGFSVIAGAVTVNAADAAFADASVALTVCGPSAKEDGTVMEPVKLPVEVLVMVVVVVVIPAILYDIVMAEFAAKLLPEMFTVVPVGPLVGFSVIAGVVTVNDADAEFADASVALTV